MRTVGPILLRLVAIVGIFAASLAAPPTWAADDPPQGVFQDDWFVLLLDDGKPPAGRDASGKGVSGKKCGYMHGVTERVGDEIRTRADMRFELSRGPAKVSIAMEQSYRETLDGAPLGFKHTMRMGAIPQTQTGTVRDGQLTLVSEQMGSKKEALYPFDPDIRFAWGQLLEMRRRGLKEGTTYTVKTYEPALRADAPIEAKIRIMGREPVDVFGTRRNLVKVSTTMQLGTMGVESISWVDDDGDPVVTTIDMPFARFRMYQATREVAMAEADPPELFVSTFVTADRRVGPDARAATYRLRVPRQKDSNWKMPELPATAMQSVRKIGDHEALVTIRRLDWDRIRTSDKDDVKGGDEYLRASPTLDTDDELIRRLAREASTDAETPAEKADALRRFVTQYVRDKGLDIGFATAVEVARDRRGDCTEHGVLLAALARASGLPARGVSGLVEIPAKGRAGKKGSQFGYHMWTQVLIGGQWVDIDAAMRQTDVDATHIALTLMPLNDESVADSALALLPLLGRLEIEVVDVEK